MPKRRHSWQTEAEIPLFCSGSFLTNRRRLAMAIFICCPIRLGLACGFRALSLWWRKQAICPGHALTWRISGAPGRRRRKRDFFRRKWKSTVGLALCMLWILGETQNIWKWGV